jgi:hypothetical protein
MRNQKSVRFRDSDGVHRAPAIGEARSHGSTSLTALSLSKGESGVRKWMPAFAGMTSVAGARTTALVFLLTPVFWLLSSPALATTVTGTVKDSQGNPVAGATVRLQLENCGAGGVCTLTGGGGIVSTLPVSTTTASDGTFSIIVNGNDTITPAGTFYEVRYIAAAGTIYSANYNVTGTSFNLNNATPLGAMPPAPIAAAYTTVEQGGTTLQQRQLLNFTGAGHP